MLKPIYAGTFDPPPGQLATIRIAASDFGYEFDMAMMNLTLAWDPELFSLLFLLICLAPFALPRKQQKYYLTLSSFRAPPL